MNYELICISGSVFWWLITPSFSDSSLYEWCDPPGLGIRYKLSI